MYTYDNNNRIKEEIKFRGENERENRNVYNYDEQGNIQEILMYDVNDNKDKLLKYVYENN